MTMDAYLLVYLFQKFERPSSYRSLDMRFRWEDLVENGRTANLVSATCLDLEIGTTEFVAESYP